MDKIPEPLIPITHRKNGKYYTKKDGEPIPKNWTIYHLDADNVIRKNGHLDYSTTGNSDIKMYRHARFAKKPYEWYVAKDNEQFVLEKESSSPPLSSSPISIPKSGGGGKKSRTRRRNRRGTRRK